MFASAITGELILSNHYQMQKTLLKWFQPHICPRPCNVGKDFVELKHYR